jgi:DNA polymerase I-like protein with 3'-5' exonuclease and polymerase domains
MIYVVTQQILPESHKFKIISLEEALAKLELLKKVGLDTETRGFDPYTKELLMLQLGCYEFQVVIDLTTVSVNYFRDYLLSNRLFIGWNIKFDLKFLLHKKIVIDNVYDGFLAEKLMYNGYPSGFHGMSLKAAGKRYLGVELDKTVRGKVMWAGLSEDVIEYAANDVKYLEKIMYAQMIELERLKLSTALIYENKSVPWVAYTEYCGVLLDGAKWEYKMLLDDFNLSIFEKALNDWIIASAKGKEFAYHYLQTEGWDDPEDLDKARKKMKGERCPEADIRGPKRGYFEAWKVPVDSRVSGKYIKEDLQGDLWLGFNTEPICTINWDSPMQVIPLLKSLGFNLLAKDKETGEWKDSTEATVIESQQDKSTIAYLYLQYKAAKKVTSTYGRNVLVQVNETSGRLHTNFNQLGTDTGRLSSGGEDKVNKIKYLNFQNFPASPETRACFIAGKGMKWISCDYSGQESRIIADVADDPAMIDLFNNGCGDVHSLVAKMSFPDIIGDCPIEQIKKRFHGLRNDVKSQVEFPINYGGDWNTIKMHSGKTEEESKRIYNNYMKGFVGIKKYQDKQRKFVMDNGYIILNPLTLHRAFIYDYDILMGIKRRLTTEFWSVYRSFKGKENTYIPKIVKQQLYKRFSDGEPFESMVGMYTYEVTKGGKKTEKSAYVSLADVYVLPAKHFFKRKSTSEKHAINYCCQATGALMFKVASIFLWEYLRKHDLVFKVKLCVPCHDEWNIEVPEEIADEMLVVLKDCMKRAGAFFCKKVEVPAEGGVYDYWVH